MSTPAVTAPMTGGGETNLVSIDPQTGVLTTIAALTPPPQSASVLGSGALSPDGSTYYVDFYPTYIVIS